MCAGDINVFVCRVYSLRMVRIRASIINIIGTVVLVLACTTASTDARCAGLPRKAGANNTRAAPYYLRHACDKQDAN